MSHVPGKSRKLIARIRRLQGQLEGVVRAIEADQDCARILQTTAACRGAFTGLVLELFQSHIDAHITGASSLSGARKEAQALNRILRSYLK